MSEPNREAVEAAAKALNEANVNSYGLDNPTALAEAALKAALPHIFAAKDAEIAALLAVVEAAKELVGSKMSSFKARNGAEQWLARRGYNPDGSRK